MLKITLRRNTAAVSEFDRRGYRRSAVTLPSYRKGKPAPNKGRKFPPEPLTQGEVHRLLEHMGPGYVGARDRAVVVVLWRCGLRIAEALALYPKDVDVEAGTVTVLHGKGDRRRVVGIDPEAVGVVEKWLELRSELGLDKSRPLFCVISKGGSFGRACHSSVFREKLKDAAVKAEIAKRVHPHGLRHTCASEMANEGIKVMSIQDHLGHSNPATTFRYIHRLSPWESIGVAQRRTWQERSAATDHHAAHVEEDELA
jgi:integrase